MKIVIASNNAKKLKELRNILRGLGVEVLSPADIGILTDPEETGSTFEENARIKARAMFGASGEAALADDSGLETEALGGAPGVYSARFGAPEAVTDAQRAAYLLEKMRHSENRAARFVCVIHCVLPGGAEFSVRGEARGEILREPRGEGGFGYDPVFYLPELGLTMAELDAGTKNKISHRALALAAFCEELEKRFIEERINDE